MGSTGNLTFPLKFKPFSVYEHNLPLPVLWHIMTIKEIQNLDC